MGAAIETLDARWQTTESVLFDYSFWAWHEPNGVFDYRLTYDRRTREFYLHVDRVDAGRNIIHGPYKNHETATRKVIKHLQGGI